MDKETVAAISTPPGIGAIGVVRMSGKASKGVLGRIWKGVNNHVDNFITHRFYYGKIINLSTGGLVDSVMAVFMAAPNSYTGEDVVEIHCHGGQASTSMVLEAVIGAGARPAPPGEFTKRAFMNGKLDLAQAEAVAGVIMASSERALRLANEQLEGRLSGVVHRMQEGLKEAKAVIEASIDFPEEDIGCTDGRAIKERLAGIKSDLAVLSSTYNEGRLIQEGVRAVIAGKPNAGKSSLLNAIVGKERAIVHHSPGTTRDTVEEDVLLDGVVFHLIDTAGIRDSRCEIENMGIRRTRSRLSEADLAIVVLDAGRPLDVEDEMVLKETEGKKRILALNKADIARPDLLSLFAGGIMEEVIHISAKTGLGIDVLKKRLVRDMRLDSPRTEGVVITNLRHKEALLKGEGFVSSALSAVLSGEGLELVACHLQEAMDSLGEITGEVTTDDILNEIFSKFCIGK